jgi:hypothetical protein
VLYGDGILVCAIERVPSSDIGIKCAKIVGVVEHELGISRFPSPARQDRADVGRDIHARPAPGGTGLHSGFFPILILNKPRYDKVLDVDRQSRGVDLAR